jgi:hypothetical protein
MAISVVIGCLDFDKRKGLMSFLEGRNDVVRHNRQQRYRCIMDVTCTLIHINVDAIMSRGTRVKFL